MGVTLETDSVKDKVMSNNLNSKQSAKVLNFSSSEPAFEQILINGCQSPC